MSVRTKCSKFAAPKSHEEQAFSWVSFVTLVTLAVLNFTFLIEVYFFTVISELAKAIFGVETDSSHFNSLSEL